MEFQKKLSMTMMRFLFLMLCCFGALSMFWFSRSMIRDTVSYNMNIYAALSAEIEARKGDAASGQGDAGLADTCRAFLQSLYSPDIALFLRAENGEMAYSSDPGRVLPEDGAILPEREELVYHKLEGRYLYISSLVNARGARYALVYSADMRSVYRRIFRYVAILLIFLAISGVAAARIIRSFSRAVSRPLHELSVRAKNWEESDNGDIGQNPSEITEINILFSCFAEMRREISDKMEELTRQNEEKQQFIDSLTHEIRTPLTSIIGYSSLLENMPFDEEKSRAAFHTIHENGVRIEELAESLIRLISLRTDKAEIRTFSLRELLEDVRKRFVLRLEEQGIALTISGEDIRLTTDRGLLDIMVSNFVDNAIKAEAGQPVRRITLEIGGESLAIRDTGKGIPAEDVGRIFQPFFMVDRSRKRSTRGFGLGLSINDMIRQKLGMTVRVDSALSEGTVITIGFSGGMIA